MTVEYIAGPGGRAPERELPEAPYIREETVTIRNAMHKK